MWVESVIRTDYRVVIVNWLLPCDVIVIVTLSHQRVRGLRGTSELPGQPAFTSRTGKYSFSPVHLTTSRIGWQLYPIDLYSAICYDDKYINYIQTDVQVFVPTKDTKSSTVSVQVRRSHR